MPKTKAAPKKAMKKPYPKKTPQPRTRFVNAPSAQSCMITTQRPQVSRGVNKIVVKHREYFATVSGTSVAFEAVKFQVNPGNAGMFPWLATQAAGWERYRFRHLNIEYVPRCSTTQNGTVILAPDYDAADETPANESIACSYADAVSGAPWSPVLCKLSAESLGGGMTSKFVRFGALAANLDVKMYDAASLFLCKDSTGAATWGKLWVEYEVELITPHTLPTPWTSTWVGKFPTPISGSQIFIGNVTNAVIDSAGPISLYNALTPANSDRLTIEGLIPGMQYLAQLLVTATGAGTVASTYFTNTYGLLEKNQILTNWTTTFGAAGKKSAVLESVFQALDTTATIGASLTSTVLGGVQLIMSPIKTDSAWTIF